MWLWLQDTPLALWVAESIWPYPIILSLHAIGLAAAVGVFAMRDLRLLGLYRGLQPAAFLQIGKLGWAGFTLNAITGSLLFISQADTFAHSTPFLVKISCIFVAMLLTTVLQAKLRGPLAAVGGDDRLPGATRLLALGSLLLWLSAIVAGRLIAYL
jgi:hypothetical protein